MSAIDRAFAFTIGQEGGYTDDASDPGNWTGGAVGAGRLAGTKWGISAAAYPSLAIADLTQADALTIYRTRYWDRIAGDQLPAALAIATFDAAINSGPAQAVKWLQRALGVVQDGDAGPVTIKAAAEADAVAVAAEAITYRLDDDSQLFGWRTFGLGWTRRCVRLAMTVAAP